METSKDYFDDTLTILFEPGEVPTVPNGYEVIERTEPSYFRGFLNPGCIVCRLSPNEADQTGRPHFEECYTDDDPSTPGPYCLSPGCFKPMSSLTTAAPVFFGWLYRKLFNAGRAYRGYWHWELADLLRRLSV